MSLPSRSDIEPISDSPLSASQTGSWTDDSASRDDLRREERTIHANIIALYGVQVCRQLHNAICNACMHSKIKCYSYSTIYGVMV